MRLPTSVPTKAIEKKQIADFNIPYTGISTGKFRRYLDPKNFSDPFRVMKGFVEARNYLKNYQPDVVFSKGGFVSVPVVRAAASLHIPCIIHESDMTPGLANKLCIPVDGKVCCNFPETIEKHSGRTTPSSTGSSHPRRTWPKAVSIADLTCAVFTDEYACDQ